MEVMILAQEEPKADLLILDDNATKKTAKFLGLTVTGTLGIIIKAKNQGLIKSATELLEEIIGNGFYVSLEVKEFVKKASGE